MSGYSVRSIMCRLWLMLMLLNDALIRLVHAATLAANSAYQACLASPSTCTGLCSPRPPSNWFIYLAANSTKSDQMKEQRSGKEAIGWTERYGED